MSRQSISIETAWMRLRTQFVAWPSRWPARHGYLLHALIALFTIGLLLFPSRLAFPQQPAAEPLKGEISVSTTGVHAPVIRFSEEVEAQVRLSSSILVISFRSPSIFRSIGSISRR